MERGIEEILAYLNGFAGKSIEELFSYVNLATKAKNRNRMLSEKLLEAYLGPGFSVSNAPWLLKTIRLDKNSRPKESCAFPTFRCADIANNDFAHSEIRKTLDGDFLFFATKDSGREVFAGAFIYRLPKAYLDGEVKEVYEKTREVIRSGDVVKCRKDNRLILNFPRESEQRIAHVRPHGRNQFDVDHLPVRDTKTGITDIPKHCFWLNKDFIEEIAKANLNLEG